MNTKSKTTSIYILEIHKDFLKKRAKQIGSTSLYILYLIHVYQNILEVMNDSEHTRILCTYQNANPELEIYSIKINTHVWAMLKNIKQSTGFSLSFIISFLIALDMRKTAIRKKVRFFLRFSKNQFTNILTNVRGEIKRTIDLSTNFISTIHLLIGIQIE